VLGQNVEHGQADLAVGSLDSGPLLLDARLLKLLPDFLLGSMHASAWAPP